MELVGLSMTKNEIEFRAAFKRRDFEKSQTDALEWVAKALQLYESFSLKLIEKNEGYGRGL